MLTPGETVKLKKLLEEFKVIMEEKEKLIERGTKEQISCLHSSLGLPVPRDKCTHQKFTNDFGRCCCAWCELELGNWCKSKKNPKPYCEYLPGHGDSIKPCTYCGLTWSMGSDTSLYWVSVEEILHDYKE